jgi:hypothetical protein
VSSAAIVCVYSVRRSLRLWLVGRIGSRPPTYSAGVAMGVRRP